MASSMPGRAETRLREMDSARASARRLASPSIFHLSMRNWATSCWALEDAVLICCRIALASAAGLEYWPRAREITMVKNKTAHSHALSFIAIPHVWKAQELR